MCIIKTNRRGSLSRVQAWSRASRALLKPHHPFGLHQILWRRIYERGGWNEEQSGPPPLWLPTQQEGQATNVWRFLQRFKAGDGKALAEWSGDNADDLLQLQRLSFSQPEAFWTAVLRELRVTFETQPSRCGGGAVL